MALMTSGHGGCLVQRLRKTVVNRRTMAAQLTDAVESGEIVQLQELKDQLDMIRVEMLVQAKPRFPCRARRHVRRG